LSIADWQLSIGNRQLEIGNNTMRILIADKFEQSGRDGLQALGCEISYQPDLKDEALVDAIRTVAPDVLVVRGTKVTEPMLEAGPVKLVVRAGAGYNTIDVSAASKRGIYVSNCPGKNSIVASLTTSSHSDAENGTRKSFRKRADYLDAHLV
jgi:phosphoglycerate dehydrogenase-like enzyme